MTNALKWQIEFPDFPAADMPALPAFADDISWHNDSCPSFMIAGDTIGAHVVLFVDYADAERREFPDTARYSIRYLALKDIVDIYEGDDWTECLKVATAEALAWRFAADVMAELSPAEWHQMRIVNRTVSEGVCASHDFRDANMTVAESFEAIAGHPALPEEGEMADSDVELWNAAWHIATPRYLTSDTEGERFDSWRRTGGPNNGVLMLYNPGQIDISGDSFVVTVSNLSEMIPTKEEAERVLWCLYASEQYEPALYLVANTTRACYWRTSRGYVAVKPDVVPADNGGCYTRLDSLMQLKGESADTIRRTCDKNGMHK